MTPTAPSSQADARIRALIADVRATTAARQRTGRAISLAGTVVAIACILGLTALTRSARRFDTDAVAQIGRGELVSHLPTTRAALQRHLEREAPAIVRSSLDGLLDLLPELRRVATAELGAKLDQIHVEFEERVVAIMAETVPATRARLAAAWPELDDDQRVERLVAEVAADFEIGFREAVEELYPAYHAEMASLIAHLSELRDADPATLGEEARLQREIIETMLRLLLREGVMQPS